MKRGCLKSQIIGFCHYYVESSISDEGRILLMNNYMRFFTALQNFVPSVCVQNDTFETASFISEGFYQPYSYNFILIKWHYHRRR
jgi:hypothetical protein